MFESVKKINRRATQNGFTLVELVLVLVLVGILSVFVAPRLMEQKTVDSRTFYDHFRAMVRYAQKVAVAQNRSVYVRLQAGTVALCFDAACTSQVPAASGSNSGSGGASCGTTWYCEGVPSTVTYTALAGATSYVTGGNATFFFSALGEPFNTGDTPPTSTFTQKVTITVTGDSTSRSFDIERETGYVH